MSARTRPGAGGRPPLWRSLIVPAAILVAFWTLAVVGWRASGEPFVLVNFGYIGTSVAVGFGLYAVLPRERKIYGRRIALVLVGVYMLGFLGLVGAENMQLEGFWFYALTGFAGGALMHYAVAKIVGPLLFGRAWCGWACWTAMVLDLLPYRTSPGRLPGRWGWARYAHFAASLALVLVLWLAFRIGIDTSARALAWLVIGNVAYYAAGIGLAFALKDNRAFCKYLCPVSVFLENTSRPALMKIGGDASACTACGACDRACPMDVEVSDHLRSGRRVTSASCILCQACVNACPRRIPRITFGLDLSGRDRVRRRPRGESAA